MKQEQDPIHPSDEEIIQEAVEFLQQAEEAESDNRAKGLEALRFRHGEQWPAEIQNSRTLEQRPCLVINKTDAFCLQVANQQRQQRPRIKVEPAGGGAKKRVADVIKGMIRHIENNGGGGDLAYDTGFDSSITIGWGYWRVMSRYVREDAFEQELYLAPIDNPFSCYRDPDSTMPDGSDTERFLITDKMGKKQFKRAYPDADEANFIEGGSGDSAPGWLSKDQIRIAEYFKIRRKKAVLCMLSDGTKAWKDDLPAPEVLESAGVAVVDQRDSFKSVVCWYKLTAKQVLEKKELPGRYIPIVSMFGKVEVIDGKRHLSGLVKNAMDPQRQFNFWRTAMVESVALAPKPKWVIAEGQDEGHENEWANANKSATATLRYSPVTTDQGAPLPPPQRIQPEGPPQGAMAMAETMSGDLTSVLGIVDPAMRIGGNVSGKALNAERMQSDNSTFHFYDNMTRAIRFTGELLLDLIPYYYPEEGRVVRIVGDDGRSGQETINAPNPSPGENTPGPVEQVLNDVTVGQYDVVMDTGPGYNTKRQESLSVMGPMFEKNEALMQIAGDIFFRNMDFEGSETIADRMAAANPLAQIDEKSEIPPGVQMKLKQQEMAIKQLEQALQAAQMEIKFKAGLQAQKDEAATKRELIKTTAAVHIEDQENKAWREDTQINAATKRHDTEVRAQTALGVAEIHATGELLKTKVNNEHDLVKLDKEADEEERELAQKSAQNEQ